MNRQIVLLRGINLGPHRRVAMSALRDLLTEAGYEHVRTYLQSGNVVLASDATAEQLELECERLISEHFGFEVRVSVRTHDELAEVVKRNPLEDVALDPKRYQVSFLATEPDPKLVEEVASLAVEPEQFVAIGREFYAWHPNGVARSKLWARLASDRLGISATSRNWTTVTSLLAMADEV